MAATVVMVATAVQGSFIEPEVPTWRGDVGSSYYGWETFTQSYGAPNMNDSGTPGGMLFNFADGAFITSTGNIYNQATGLNIHVYGYSAVEQAVLNISSQGTEFDYESVSLWVGDGTDGMMFWADEWSLNYYEPVDGMGAITNSSYTWDVSSYEGLVSEWAFFFEGIEAHNVLDAVTVDVFAGNVPAPSAVLVFGLLGLRSQRRQ